MKKTYTAKKLSGKNYIKELQRFRERVRTEILGERNKEYRRELKKLLRATDSKIRQVVKEVEAGDKTSDKV